MQRTSAHKSFSLSSNEVSPETNSLSKCSKIYTPYDGTGTLLDVGCDNILFRAKRLPTTFRKAPHTNEHTKPTNHYS
ncbi:hypothetical protein FOXYSP1_16049 [Fusarium oxysporum f. sp. phaseoli]